MKKWKVKKETIQKLVEVRHANNAQKIENYRKKQAKGRCFCGKTRENWRDAQKTRRIFVKLVFRIPEK